MDIPATIPPESPPISSSHPTPHRWKWVRRIGGVLLIMAALIVLDRNHNPWSRLNNMEQDIDLYSGRERRTYHRFYFRTGREIRETAFSRALTTAGTVDTAPPEQWVRVNTFAPGLRISPHHRYHGALSDVWMMARFWEDGRFSQAAQAKCARQLLRIWREAELDAGQRYQDAIMDLWAQALDTKQPVTENDIPDDLDQRCLNEFFQKHQHLRPPGVTPPSPDGEQTAVFPGD